MDMQQIDTRVCKKHFTYYKGILSPSEWAAGYKKCIVALEKERKGEKTTPCEAR